MKQILLKSKWIGSSIVTLLVLTTWMFPQHAFAQEDFSVNAKAAIAIDATTGKIFYEKNSEEALPIASMTKLLTLYIVLEAIDNGDLSWNDKIQVNDHLYKLSNDMELSNIPFTQDGTYSVQDLFNATEIVSANAAAIALAEKVAGSEEKFVDKMRKKAEAWGLNDAYIISTSGINNEDAKGQIYPGSNDDEENLMSAKSMAIVAQHLIKDFPEFLEFTKKPSEIFAAGTDEEVEMISWNTMLPGLQNEKEGVDGLKTGTTILAGACFTGTINRDGKRVITVVMNVDNGQEDNNIRFVETSNLMDYVYDNWQYETLFQKGSTVPTMKKITVQKGKELEVPVILGDDVKCWTRKDMTKENIDTSFKPDKKLVNKDNAIIAPIEAKKEIGKVFFELPEDQLGYVQDKSQHSGTSVLTSKKIEKASWWTLVGRAISGFFSN